MRVELKLPESVTEPRLWVWHEQVLAMVLRPGSIEWGLQRSAMERVDYTAGDLGLRRRHVGDWVGIMNVPTSTLGSPTEHRCGHFWRAKPERDIVEELSNS